MFAKVIFLLPTRKAFTYSVPENLRTSVQPGVRVAAPFGKRMLTGFVASVSKEKEVDVDVKSIYDVLDSAPIVTENLFKFYEWISEYYICSLGEALRNAIPGGTEIETKRKIISTPEFCKELFENEKNKRSIKAKLLELLSEKENHTIKSLQKALHKKNIYGALRSLEKEGAVSILDVVEKPKVGIKKQKFVRLKVPSEEVSRLIPLLEKRSPKQAILLIFLSGIKKEIALAELLQSTKSSQSSVESLAGKGYLEIFDKEIERIYSDSYSEKKEVLTPNPEQKNAIEKIIKSAYTDEFHPFLLYGVTGSGKTQVYIELVKKVLSKGKSALVLVPEISLTPQITSRFYNAFGNSVAVFHSRMSHGERYDVWRGVLSGKYKVVVGPRSALFMPLKKLGIIVVDEEHDASYKQHDNVPRYHARDAAIVRAQIENVPVVLGSATPSLETMYNVELGKYTLLKLEKRADDANLPNIKLVNLNVERKSNRLEGSLSKSLLDEIAKRIVKKEGVIILQNRRGFATNIFCEDCGHVEECPNCSVSLVYHIATNDLRCHYCGFKKEVPKACSVCGSIAVNFFGTGIQKVEDELAYHFPEANIVRVDSDTMKKKGKLGFIFKEFREKRIDVLVGTQMVSKGLDIPHLTLVGVVSAEATLWLPDFRADERTFQLLTQVSGRSGRSKISGEVIIQTENPNHFVLQQVMAGNYERFYNHEMKLRKEGQYPPFTRLGLIESKDENARKARGAIQDFFKFLIRYKKQLVIMPPSEAVIAKIKREFRFQIVVKSFRKADPAGKVLREAIFESFIEFNKQSRFREVKLIIDIDPQNIL